jgi:hypothetical protein
MPAACPHAHNTRIVCPWPVHAQVAAVNEEVIKPQQLKPRREYDSDSDSMDE